MTDDGRLRKLYAGVSYGESITISRSTTGLGVVAASESREPSSSRKTGFRGVARRVRRTVDVE